MDKNEFKPNYTLQDLFDRLENRKWHIKLYDRVYGVIYRLPMNTRHFLRCVKSYFIRGKRGWAPMDTWSLDFHLAKVIRDSVLHLKDTTQGYPSDLSSLEEWQNILDKIVWTFDFVIKIDDLDIFYFDKEGFESEERYEQVKERIERSCRGRMATEEEIAKYKEGWTLFQKYFIGLWS